MAAVTMEKMAAALGVSLPTMRRLIMRYDDLPVLDRGGNGKPWAFDPEAVIAFVQTRRAEEAAGRAQRDELLAQISLPMEELIPPEERSLSAADRLKVAQAMLKEDEVAKQRGFLVQTTEMRQRLTEAWTPLNQFLQSLPSAIGRRHNLPDAVVRDIRRLVEQQQRELHRRLKDLLAPDAAPPPEETTPHAEGA